MRQPTYAYTVKSHGTIGDIPIKFKNSATHTFLTSPKSRLHQLWAFMCGFGDVGPTKFAKSYHMLTLIWFMAKK